MPPAPSSAPPALSRFLTGLLRAEGTLAALAYGVACGLLLLDVLLRELAGQSLWGAQKAAVYATIIAALLGLTMAVGTGTHLRPRFADGLLPWPWVDRLGHLVSALLFAILCGHAVGFVTESARFGDRAEILLIPLWPVQAVFAYAFATAALRHALFGLIPALAPRPTTAEIA